MPQLVVACLISLVAVVPVQATVVLNRTDQRHERFAHDSQFVGAGVDFSGVGRTSNGGWVTMISERHFLSSGHLWASGTVEFRFDNSPLSSAPTATCDIASSFEISNGTGMPPTDLRFGTIDITSCTFTNMAVTPLHFYQIANYDSSNPAQFDGQIVLQAGDSSQTFGTNLTTNFRVGRNEITVTSQDETLDVVPLGDRKSDWAFYADDSAAGDLSLPQVARAGNVIDPDETYFQGGDSGGPTFLLGSGELIGIHSFTNGQITYSDEDERRASGDVFLPRYKTQLLASTAVPEPSQWLLISIVLLGITLQQVLRR